jgi:hypothetical protein
MELAWSLQRFSTRFLAWLEQEDDGDVDGVNGVARGCSRRRREEMASAARVRFSRKL